MKFGKRSLMIINSVMKICEGSDFEKLFFCPAFLNTSEAPMSSVAPTNSGVFLPLLEGKCAGHRGEDCCSGHLRLGNHHTHSNVRGV